jgi:hypothetical protein
VVRTGRRILAFEALLLEANVQLAHTKPPAPRIGSLTSEWVERIYLLYREFGGRDQRPVLRPGPWDLALNDGLVIELDEELHFNRYRQATLSPFWAQSLPWHNDYVAYCRTREAECLAGGQWGKRWTNQSCERMFGPADSPGTLEHRGAPRWKQRALYDALKDAYALSGVGPALARVSIYDRVGESDIAAIVDGSASVEADVILKWLADRTLRPSGLKPTETR